MWLSGSYFTLDGVPRWSEKWCGRRLYPFCHLKVGHASGLKWSLIKRTFSSFPSILCKFLLLFIFVIALSLQRIDGNAWKYEPKKKKKRDKTLLVWSSQIICVNKSHIFTLQAHFTWRVQVLSLKIVSFIVTNASAPKVMDFP